LDIDQDMMKLSPLKLSKKKRYASQIKSSGIQILNQSKNLPHYLNASGPGDYNIPINLFG